MPETEQEATAHSQRWSRVEIDREADWADSRQKSLPSTEQPPAEEDAEEVARDEVSGPTQPVAGEEYAQAGATTGIQPTGPGRDWGIRRQVQLAYDAALEVWVKNLQESVVTAEQTFYEHGGFVLDSTMMQVESVREPRQAEIVGKVPKENVAEAVNALAALGWVARRDILGEDLTDQYTQATRTLTKLEEQIEKLNEERKTASAARRNAIDEEIKGLKDELGPAQDTYHEVQKELVLSTINARLVEKTPREQAGKALRAAWDSFTYVLARVGVLLAWVVLFGVFLVPVIFGYVIYRRHTARADGASARDRTDGGDGEG
jgi:hypothetical protein